MENIIDYTGKLNNNEDYLKILEKLEIKTKYIEVVITFGNKSSELVEKFKGNIIENRKVKEWWGTLTTKSNNLYKIKATPELFDYLRQFETFCKYYVYGSNAKTLSYGDYSETTDFGYDDIAFYDKNNKFLLGTTTHEGYILIDRNLAKEIL